MVQSVHAAEGWTRGLARQATHGSIAFSRLSRAQALGNHTLPEDGRLNFMYPSVGGVY